MPTGYTSELYDLKPQTRNEFILQCSRAFGATIMQRDDPMTDPPKLREYNTDYYDKGLVRAREDLATIPNWTEAEANAKAKQQHEEALAAWEASSKKSLERRRNYERMLAEITRWTPPSNEHLEFKKFMVDQLESSIDFDCHMYDPPVAQTGREYKDMLISSAKRDIEYYTEQRQQEFVRVDGSNKWITDIFNSLKEN